MLLIGLNFSLFSTAEEINGGEGVATTKAATNEIITVMKRMMREKGGAMGNDNQPDALQHFYKYFDIMISCSNCGIMESFGCDRDHPMTCHACDPSFERY